MDNKKRQVFAIIAIILLGGLYVAAFVFAIIDNPISNELLKVSFAMTLVVPIFLYVYTWLIKRARDRYENRETGIREGHKPLLIVMLTRNDMTVADAPEIFRKYKDSEASCWGFKEDGLPKEEMKALCSEIKEYGKHAMLEVVAYEEEACLESATFAIECGFDALLGTLFFDSVNDLCRKNGIMYMPFVGNVHERPSVLDGDIDSMISQANDYIKKGVTGIDLLAYRYTGDYHELIRRFTSEVNAPVCIAGSINSYERLDEIKAASPWSFTIGSAFFNKEFGNDFGKQINDVCRHING